MLQRIKRNYFSQTSSQRIEEFYERMPREKLLKKVQEKRNEMYINRKLKIPGRKAKVIIGMCKIFNIFSMGNLFLGND